MDYQLNISELVRGSWAPKAPPYSYGPKAGQYSTNRCIKKKVRMHQECIMKCIKNNNNVTKQVRIKESCLCWLLSQLVLYVIIQ